MTTPDDETTDARGTAVPERPRRSPARAVGFTVLGIALLVGLLYGAIFLYTEVINDAPAELDAADLSAAIDTSTSDPVVVGSAPAAADTTGTTAPDAVPGGSAAASPAGFEGDWVPTSESAFGYRVQEVLAGVDTTAVGRSNEISGLMTVDGTTVPVVEIEVEVASITSDEGLRDNQFRGRIMSVDEFPTATFSLTAPIEFGTLPADGEQVTATATGDLTLRGVTNAVTFEVTAEANDDRIGVLGSIPILFGDYGIENPSFGAVRTEDDGLLEFVLVFEPA